MKVDDVEFLCSWPENSRENMDSAGEKLLHRNV